MDDNSEKEHRNAESEMAPAPSGERADYPAVDDSSRSREKWQYRLQWWNAIVGALTLIAVLAYTTVAYRQWRQTVRLNNLTDATLQETKRSNADTLALTKQANILGLRAWVVVGSIPRVDPQEGKFIHLIAKIHNVGKLPALNLVTEGKVLIKPEPRGKDFTFAEATDGGALGPGQSGMVIADSRIFTLTDRQVLMAGKTQIYFLGIVRYTDPLGSQGHTEFCARYDWREGAFDSCRTHNSVR